MLYPQNTAFISLLTCVTTLETPLLSRKFVTRTRPGPATHRSRRAICGHYRANRRRPVDGSIEATGFESHWLQRGAHTARTWPSQGSTGPWIY